MADTMADTMANAFVSIQKEMQRLVAATAEARKELDEAVLKLKLAEEREQKFKQEISALTGAVGSGSKQNTQVAAPASGASCAASNGGVDSQSDAPKHEHVPKGRGAPQQKRAKPGWTKFLPRSTPAAWAKRVQRWFGEHAVDRRAFLNTDGLTKKTVRLMAKFPIDEVILILSKTLSGRISVSGKGGQGLGSGTQTTMLWFDHDLQDNFQYQLDNFGDPTEKPEA